MKRKKQFVAPRVIQEVQIQLEEGLLVLSMERDAEVIIPGMENVDTDTEDTEMYEVFYD